jgi:hypothetical protein
MTRGHEIVISNLAIEEHVETPTVEGHVLQLDIFRPNDQQGAVPGLVHAMVFVMARFAKGQTATAIA